MINVLITIQSDDMLMHESLIVFLTVRFSFCICFKDSLLKIGCCNLTMLEPHYSEFIRKILNILLVRWMISYALFSPLQYHFGIFHFERFPSRFNSAANFACHFSFQLFQILLIGNSIIAHVQRVFTVKNLS